MSVRSVLAKIVKQSRLVIQGVTRKTEGQVKTFHVNKQATSGKSNSVKPLHLGNYSTLSKSLVGRNIQSCTYRSFAAELRRQAAIRLSGNLYGKAIEVARLARSRLPIYAFVTLGFASYHNQEEEPDFSAISQNIKNIFACKSPSTPEEPRPADDVHSLAQYELGPMVGKGCNAAVHIAKSKTDDVDIQPIGHEDGKVEDTLLEIDLVDLDVEMSDDAGAKPATDDQSKTNYDLAIKMMFNYNIESDADSILREMQNELLPVRHLRDFEELGIWHNGNHVKKKRLKPHPNIVVMPEAFVDKMPLLEEGYTEYPLALPSSMYQNGFGRNKTMFAVMKRYDITLEDYLKKCRPGWFEATCLLAQLVEAVVHLNIEQIAHRDIKTNNILLDLKDGQVPDLVLSDFGSCLDASVYGWRIRYENDLIDRGGNPCLMAPEISSPHPGPWSYLDYTKADLWAVGAIAYEIFGAENPFYGDNDNTLHSKNFKEKELPPLPEGVPAVIDRIVRLILNRDPSQRPSALEVSYMLQFVLWCPREWFLQTVPPAKVSVMHWLLVLTTEVLMEKSSCGSKRSTCQLKETFLTGLEFDILVSSIELLYSSV